MSIGKVIQTLMITLICLAVLEGLIAFSLYVPWAYQLIPTLAQGAVSRIYTKHLVRHISLLPECAQYDQETFYILKANSTCNYSNIEFDTTYSINSAGVRDDELALTEPKIIALGDSFTMGVGVEQDETFVERLAALTGENILNAGISSFGTEREYLLLKRFDLSKLRIVILQYSDNDFLENAEAVRQKNLNIKSRSEYNRISAKHLRKTEYFPFKFAVGFFRDAFSSGIQIINRKIKEKTKTHLGEEVKNFLTIFAKIRQVAPSAKYILTELNGLKRSRTAFLNSVNEYFMHDSLVSVIKIEDKASISNYLPIDGHLNRSGHEFVAKGLAPLILQYLEEDESAR